MDVDRETRGDDLYPPASEREGGRGGAGGGAPGTIHGRGRFAAPREAWEKSVGGPMNAPTEEAEAHAKVSKRENRLYIGNLAYDCNYKDLEGFMKTGGWFSFLFGCGIGLDSG